MRTYRDHSWTKQHTLYALVSAWCILAAVVVVMTLNFAYHHPAEFLRCGGRCPAVEPCRSERLDSKDARL
jgi:hypothetical protein